jgi:hypothetical protein
MNLSFNFLLQSARVLEMNIYDDDELEMIYNYVISLDNDILNHYNNNRTISSYFSDIELYIEILDVLIYIFIDKEEYERCGLLKKKKEGSLIIMNKNQNYA